MGFDPYTWRGQRVDPLAYAADPGTHVESGHASCQGCRHLKERRKPSRLPWCSKAEELHGYRGAINPVAPACALFRRRYRP